MKRLLVLVFLVACGSNTKSAPPPTPVATTPADAGSSAQPAATDPPKKEPPPEEKLTCPSPAVAAALRSCDGIDATIPTQTAIMDAMQKMAMEAVKRPPKRGKTEAERLAPRPISKATAEYLKLTRTYTCKNETSRDRGEIAFAEGRAYFELQHWEEASVIFDELALGSGDIVGYAAQLALAAWNVLASKLNRPDCFHTMEVRLPQYIAHLCSSDTMTPRRADPSTCEQLKRIRDELKASPRRSGP